MIVNIRGTSGSGKSHIIRQIMEDYGGKELFRRDHETGRKQPLGYYHEEGRLYIPGHYETQCGGCDTIHGHDAIFKLVRDRYEEGYHVLFEGLLVSEEVVRTIKLAQEYPDPFWVLGIDEPIAVCLASINARRRIKNPDAGPVNPDNTTKRVAVIRRAVKRIELAGVRTKWGNREVILAKTRELLGCV
jgi:hypothetical protein